MADDHKGLNEPLCVCGSGPASGKPGSIYGEPSEDGLCPKCKSDIQQGYGLAGGGMGSYEYCLNDDCDWFYKVQDSEE